MSKAGIDKFDQMNFNGGEISPLLYSRPDLEQVGRGCRTLKNMYAQKYGNVTSRQGTVFAGETKDSSKKSRSIPFVFSIYDTFNIEVGEYYFRFYKDGGPVYDGEDIYEVAHPYTEDQVQELQYVQINDVMMITCQDHPPYRLMRYGDVNWVMEEIPFDEPPFLQENITSTTITPSGKTGNITLSASASLFDPLHVGAYFKLGHRRDAQTVKLDLTATGTSSSIPIKGKFTVRTSGTWSGTLEVQRQEDGVWKTVYTFESDKDQNFNNQFEQEKVYESWRLKFTYIEHENSSPRAMIETESIYSYGWVRITSVTSSTLASASVKSELWGTTGTSLWMEGAWSNYRGYPRSIAFFQDRIIYGGTYYQPQSITGSYAGDYYNFEGITGVTDQQDSYAFTHTIGSSERVYIMWLRPAGNSLIVGTSSGLFSFAGSNGGDDPLTGSNVVAKPQPSTGDAPIMPLMVGDAILHVQRDLKKLYELNYSISSYGYKDGDITTFSEHITDPGITSIAFQRQPDNALWMTRADGKLLHCVYDQEQKVVSWSLMETQGDVECVSCIHTERGDEVWIIVKRTLGDGTVKRYNEYIKPEKWTSKSDAWFVDSGVGSSTEYIEVGLPAPIITRQPADLTAFYGRISVDAFSVAAIELTYTWYFKAVGEVDFVPLMDQPYEFVLFDWIASDDEGEYFCRVSQGSSYTDTNIVTVSKALGDMETSSYEIGTIYTSNVVKERSLDDNGQESEYTVDAISSVNITKARDVEEEDTVSSSYSVDSIKTYDIVFDKDVTEIGVSSSYSVDSIKTYDIVFDKDLTDNNINSSYEVNYVRSEEV